MTTAETLTDALRINRAILKQTQQQAATSINVHIGTYNAMEKHGKLPETKILPGLREWLDVSWSQLGRWIDVAVRPDAKHELVEDAAAPEPNAA